MIHAWSNHHYNGTGRPPGVISFLKHLGKYKIMKRWASKVDILLDEKLL
jgi:hypothetical protein